MMFLDSFPYNKHKKQSQNTLANENMITSNHSTTTKAGVCDQFIPYLLFKPPMIPRCAVFVRFKEPFCHCASLAAQ